MKGGFRELIKRFNRYVMEFVFVILLLIPNSTSLLCVAAGGHIAIENIGANCCAAFDISPRAEGQPDNGFNAAGDCHNCIDFFIASYVQVVASKSYSHAAASPFADECPEIHRSIDVFPSLCQPVGITTHARPISVPSSVPMRC